MNMARTGASRLRQAADQRALPPDRVVVLNDFSKTGHLGGGATSVALQSARLLVAKGVPVSFLAGDSGEFSDDVRGSMDTTAFGALDLWSASRVRGAVQGLYNLQAGRFLSGWIAENDTPRTIYHLHSWCKILSPAVFRSLRPVAERLVISAHDFFLACPNGGFFNYPSGRICDLRPMTLECLRSRCDRRNHFHKLWRFARHGVMRAFCALGNAAGAVVAVHDGMVPLLQRSGLSAENMFVLRNPSVPWRPKRIRAESNREFFFVGRLETDKGADLLARAAARVGAPVCMIGAGSLKEALNRDFPQVRQMGWKESGEIGEFVAGARVLVMPTRSRESFGLAAIEALTSGLPVLVSSHSMIAGEVERLGFGFACDPNDQVRFSDLLERLSKDHALVEQMSRNAYRQARHKLGPRPEEWIETLLGLYSQLLSAERVGPRR